MPTTTLTSKGQVTLPKEVRDRLGLRPGHQLSFEIDADRRLVVRPKTVDLMSLGGLLRRRRAKKKLRQIEEGIGRGAAETSPIT
ncbi:MAG TPA: AbrB/MazE/SpoVT family DNA-binding domain-containing protein [Thermoanaerobaculia bacterium]|nr:AbrB/MazE/SpoVT family DNA-binding domain-containing protein [Thermoanaerobaculia bacterium]